MVKYRLFLLFYRFPEGGDGLSAGDFDWKEVSWLIAS